MSDRMSDRTSDTPDDADRAVPPAGADTPRRRARFMIARAAVVLIAGLWLLSGVTKVYSLPDFMTLIEVHGVLAPEWRGLGIVLPFAELLLAVLLVFVAGSELRTAFGRVVLLVSLGGIIGFAYYLSLVPDAVLQKSGCGCMGRRIASGIDESARLKAGVRTGLMVLLHLAALLGPVVGARYKRTM